MITEWFACYVVGETFTGNDRQTDTHPVDPSLCQSLPKTIHVGVKSLSGVIFVSLSGRLKRSCTLADDLIRSPSLLQPL